MVNISVMKRVIQVKDLVKAYGPLKAVNGVSFDVYEGEIFGLLGENGAGKTTTLEMIEGLRKPTSGKISVLGLDLNTHLNQIKEKIGVQLQSSAYFNFLTLTEILNLFANFYGIEIDGAELLEIVDLSSKANTFVNNLSGGQKQRFSIVASLVNDPEVVFLDEPTTGLDPIARRNLWELISRIKSQGKTIILTTHYMEEAEVLCDRIAIMDKGKILALDETHRLVDRINYPFTVKFISGIEAKIKAELVSLGELQNVFGKKNSWILKLNKQADLNQAIRLIGKGDPESLIVGKASLEDVFISLTGKTIGDENV